MYSDEPLDSIVQDNIEVDLTIGGRTYLPIELEIELTNGSEGNYVWGRIATPEEHNKKPSIGDPLEENGERPEKVEIDIDNDLMEERPDSREITRVWTGYVSNSSRIGNGLFEFRSFWPGHGKIQNAAINVDMSWVFEQSERLLGEDGNIFLSHDEITGEGNSGRFKRASFIADKIGEKITEDTDFGYEVNMEEGGVNVGTTPGGETVRAGNDIKIDMANVKTFKLTKDEEGLLQYITSETNSIWDVRRDGTFYIGAPEPYAHKLRYIVGNSAGKQSPHYLSVQVIGNNIASQDGWDKKDMTNANPESIGKRIYEDATPYQVEDAAEQLAQPTFVYRNLEINHRDEAEEVLEGIVENIKEQMGGGNIEVVGHPEVWPNNAVEMPDAKKQPFGKERYKVVKVIHRINNSDGFLTKIEVGGMTKAAEVVFGEPEEIIDDYPDEWGEAEKQLHNTDPGAGSLPGSDESEDSSEDEGFDFIDGDDEGTDIGDL